MRVDPTQAVTPREPEPSRRQAKAAAAAQEAAAQAAQKAAAQAALEVPAGRSVNVEMEGKRVYLQVVDQGTGEVVRKIPPEEIRRVGRNVARMLEEHAQDLDKDHIVDVES